MITSTVSRNLANHVAFENVSLLGSGKIDGLSNALDNTIVGNASNTILAGGSENDS